jgi:26S proteasome regulatory subunit N10
LRYVVTYSRLIFFYQLALKHRQNKSQKQRVIVFTCSPISEDEKSIVKLAKKMKKSNINVDIIAFGEPDEETEKKLKEFHEQVKSAEGSFFDVIPPSSNLLSETLVSTSLLANEGMGPVGGASGSGGEAGGMGDSQFEFGVNPEVDPELALALRMSYEEEKARQEKEKKAQEEAEARTKLEGIPEGDEKQPLLSEEGESSTKDKDDKKTDDKDQDKMDTA